MNNNPIVNCLAAIACLGAAAVIYFKTTTPSPPGVEENLHRAIGAVMARNALSLLKPGGKIVVISRDTSVFQNPAVDCQMQEFSKAVIKAKADISKTQLLKVDPLRQVEVPPGDFFDLIRKTPEGSVIVSFLGPPALNETQLRQLPLAGPSVVAFCPGNVPVRVDLKLLFDQKILHSAIISRMDVATQLKPTKPQAWFEQYYMEITPANVATALASQKKS